jgi:hypothetical protein
MLISYTDLCSSSELQCSGGICRNFPLGNHETFRYQLCIRDGIQLHGGVIQGCHSSFEHGAWAAALVDSKFQAQQHCLSSTVLLLFRPSVASSLDAQHDIECAFKVVQKPTGYSAAAAEADIHVPRRCPL